MRAHVGRLVLANYTQKRTGSAVSLLEKSTACFIGTGQPLSSGR